MLPLDLSQLCSVIQQVSLKTLICIRIIFCPGVRSSQPSTLPGVGGEMGGGADHCGIITLNSPPLHVITDAPALSPVLIFFIFSPSSTQGMSLTARQDPINVTSGN